MTVLEATLATFSEATIMEKSDLDLAAIFTTRIGFRDEVAFRVDPHLQRIDFRSRSTFGLYDFGKNRSRMTEFGERFRSRMTLR